MLVVEDYGDARVLVAEHLRDSGFEVLTAADGETAVELALAHHPRVILMDLALPGIDGFEATRRIRNATNGMPMGIVAVSAMSGAKARADATSAGCDGFIAKPCTPDALLEAVQRFVGEAEG